MLTVLCLGKSLYQQIHLSYSDSPHSLKAVWVTTLPTSSHLQLCTSHVCHTLTGTRTAYVFNDEEETGEPPLPRFLHKVEITALTPDQQYSYRVGSDEDGTWSQLYHFKGSKVEYGSAPLQSSADFIVFGDFGTCSSLSDPTLHSLRKAARSLQFDFFLHIGDFAYNLNTDNGRRGDDFFSDIEGIAAYVPYMTAVGNHERYQNYTHYRNLFDMPGDTDGFYYSFNVGPVHVVVYSSETACRHPYCPDEAQIAWLTADLQEAQRNRDEQPWVVAMSHEPLYCSVDWEDLGEYQNCIVDAEIRRAFYEDLLVEAGLDVHFHGHLHNYERTQPVFHSTPQSSRIAASHLYVNPVAPIYVVSGIAGSCLEQDVAPSSATPQAYSVFRTDELSYTRVHAEERLLRVEQVSAVTEEVIDYFLVVKAPIAKS